APGLAVVATEGKFNQRLRRSRGLPIAHRRRGGGAAASGPRALALGSGSARCLSAGSVGVGCDGTCVGASMICYLSYMGLVNALGASPEEIWPRLLAGERGLAPCDWIPGA